MRKNYNLKVRKYRHQASSTLLFLLLFLLLWWLNDNLDCCIKNGFHVLQLHSEGSFTEYNWKKIFMVSQPFRKTTYKSTKTTERGRPYRLKNKAIRSKFCQGPNKHPISGSLWQVKKKIVPNLTNAMRLMQLETQDDIRQQ